MGVRAEEWRACHLGRRDIGVPSRCVPRNAEPSPLLTLEHALHPWVAYGILPLFAFANAGVSLNGVSLESFTHHVPMGIALATC